MGRCDGLLREPCVDDSECPGGFECGTIRDPTPLCDTTKGNNNFCGTTSDACITRAILALDPAAGRR
ncbi:MAG: hypothetical protein IPJ65_25315 [Archangiaceae bacterium]|nr:hypothetical protein [Archangiaceae bacterium]